MSNTTSNHNDIVMVPVPARRLQEVYKLLGQEPHVAAIEIPDDGDGDGRLSLESWTDAFIRSLYVESNPKQRKFLEYLAHHAGKDVTSREASEALGLGKGPKSLAGMLGGMAKRAKNRYTEAALPWDKRWQWIDESDESIGSETVFQMSAEVAEIIKSEVSRSAGARTPR